MQWQQYVQRGIREVSVLLHRGGQCTQLYYFKVWLLNYSLKKKKNLKYSKVQSCQITAVLFRSAFAEPNDSETTYLMHLTDSNPECIQQKKPLLFPHFLFFEEHLILK